MVFGGYAFMTRWCKALKNILADTGSTCSVWCSAPDFDPAVQFSLVPSSSKFLAQGTELQLLREGLALFAVIAEVDAAAVVYLVNAISPRPVFNRQTFDTDERPVFIEIDVNKRSVDGVEDFSWMETFLVGLCCRLDWHNTSQEFKEAWQKLVSMRKSTASGSSTLSNLNIPVRLVVDKHEESNVSNEALKHVWNVLQHKLDPRQLCWGLSSSTKKTSASQTRLEQDTFVSFVVDSIRANSIVDGHGLGMRADFMQSIDRMSGLVRFSTFGFSVVNRQRAQDLYRMTTGLLSRAAFDDSEEFDERIASNITMKLRDGFEWEFAALCSALSVTRSCWSVDFSLHVYGPNNEAVWRWLAYAFFSKRSRSQSSVKRVKLSQVLLSPERVDAMARIISSNAPEHELFNAENQSTSTCNRDDREYLVKEEATVEVSETVCRRTKTQKAENVFRGRSISGARLVGFDDGMNDWVDALVPGVGLCKIERDNLIQHDHAVTQKCPGKLDLQLRFLSRDPECWQGLPRFLSLVGSSLRSLHLDFLGYDYANRPVEDFSCVMAECPSLRELTIIHRVVGAAAFVRACSQDSCQLRRLECEFDDISAVAAALSDPSNLLSRSLRYWYCRFQLRLAGIVSHDNILQSLRRMLTVNRTLSCLTLEVCRVRMETFHRELQRYHLQPLDLVGVEMPTPCKLAFLSIFDAAFYPSGYLQRPDLPVLAMIFQFAATRAVRKVTMVPA